MKKLKFGLMAAGMALVLGGCSSDEPADGGTTFKPEGKGYKYVAPLATRATLEMDAEAVESFNQWAYRFNQDLATEVYGTSNYVFAPVSLEACLSMVASSVEPEAAAAVVRSAGATSVGELESWSTSLMSYLTHESHKSRIFFANALWYDINVELSENFRSRMERTFGATVSQLDFAADKSIDVVLGWVSDNTEGLINYFELPLIKGNNVKFANTFYFESKWATPFKAADTKEGLFNGLHKETGVAMMHGKMSAKYYNNDDLLMAVLPYDGDFQFVIILPAEGKTVADIVTTIDYARLSELNSYAMPCKANVTLPKFSFDTEIRVQKSLLTAGYPGDNMQMLLSPEASATPVDLSPDSSYVRQNIVFAIDESGAKAASVTHTGTYISNNPPEVDVKADRPFMFMVVNAKHNIPVLAGVLNDIK